MSGPSMGYLGVPRAAHGRGMTPCLQEKQTAIYRSNRTETTGETFRLCRKLEVC